MEHMENLDLNGPTMDSSLMQLRTPVKDIPPSFGFGSSSSPFFESPPTVERASRSLQWSPQGPGKQDYRTSSSTHLLPSQFPPTGFGGLGSSPPDIGRSLGTVFPSDRSASPQPVKMRRVGKRGRPRKYDIDTEPSQSINLPLHLSNTDSRISKHNIVKPRLAPPPTDISPRVSKPRGEAQEKPAKKRVRIHTSPPASGRTPIYTDIKTDNGVPLFSSKVFELACKHQSDINGDEATALREEIADRPENQTQFKTHGMGFNFSINLGGQVTIDATTQLSPAPTPHPKEYLKNTRSAHYAQSLINEESESDSDMELGSAEDTPVRTPPRFSSLGSCDAATAFAKSLARTNDHGKGFMFLFPPVSTPDKHGQLTSYVPCTPRTPRMAMPFDETSFSMQMQTPPGAIFSYENANGGLYATGMTPFLGSARSMN